MPVIGFLNPASPDTYAQQLAAFHHGLSDGGYVERQNVAIEYRWANGQYDRLPGLAADLVRRDVTVIAATGGDVSALAAKAATATIPIVFDTNSDPVKLGLVTSLNRPSSNLTGVSILNTELLQKRLELLCEVVPNAVAVAFLVNPARPTSLRRRTYRRQGARLGEKLLLLRPARTAISTLPSQPSFRGTLARSLSAPITSSTPDAIRSWRWQHAMAFPQCSLGVNSSRPVA